MAATFTGEAASMWGGPGAYGNSGEGLTRVGGRQRGGAGQERLRGVGSLDQ